MHERDEFILKEDGRDLAASLAEALIRQLPADGYRAICEPLMGWLDILLCAKPAHRSLTIHRPMHTFFPNARRPTEGTQDVRTEG